MSLIESYKSRYATKVFDSSKKVSDTDLADILEAFRLTPSGFGLQPWKLVLVENPELRKELLPHSWNQSQVVDASHLLVFTRISNPGDELVDDYLDDMVATRGVTRQDLKGYEDMMKGFLASSDDEKKKVWSSNQVFLSIGFVLSILAEKGIDSCPLEGFIPEKYDEILGLDKEGLTSVLVLPIGYRDESDKYATLPKVRFGVDKIVIKK